MDQQEADLIRRIGALIRGDWSGVDFDGRDVNEWLGLVVEGKLEEVAAIIKRYEELW